MNAETIDLQTSTELITSQPQSESQHTDWSFLPTAAGGLTGVAIGIFLGFFLGLC